jgi:hypothetical protein
LFLDFVSCLCFLSLFLVFVSCLCFLSSGEHLAWDLVSFVFRHFWHFNFFIFLYNIIVRFSYVNII